MKKLIACLSFLVFCSASVMAQENKNYSEQDIHFDADQFLMLDKDNRPITGTVKVFFDHQKLEKEIPYIAGKKHGIETWYWLNGDKRFVVHWENGLKNGTLEEFLNDKTKSFLYTYVNGRKEGKQVTYHPNGNEEKVTYLRDGKEVMEIYKYDTGNNASELKTMPNSREEKTYYKNGQLKYIGVTDKERVTRTLYYRSGQVALEMTKVGKDIEGYVYSLSGKKTKLPSDKAAKIDLFFMHGFFRHPDTEDGWDKLTDRLLEILL